MSKKHSKKNRKKLSRTSTMDVHHILYQRKHWQNGYAHLLREHWYFKMLIPMTSLHRELHSKIHDIPTPNGKDCKVAYQKLCWYEKEGLISEYDHAEVRIQFLIDVWENRCPATVAMLKWQQDVFRKFYQRR